LRGIRGPEAITNLHVEQPAFESIEGVIDTDSHGIHGL